MMLTIESYKKNLYALDIFNNLYAEIKSQLEINPYSKLNLSWDIVNAPEFKIGFHSTVIFNKDNKDIEITYIPLQQFNSNDKKYDILSVNIFNKNKEQEKIEINNFIYIIVSKILTLLENNINI